MALSKGWYSPPRWLFLVSLLSITFSTWTLNWLLKAFHGSSSFFILHTHTSQSPLPPWTHLLFIFFQLPNLYSFWFILILSCMVDISTWSCGSEVTRVQLYSGTSSPKQFYCISSYGREQYQYQSTCSVWNLGTIQSLQMPPFCLLNLHLKRATKHDQLYCIKISWIYILLFIQLHPL